MLEVPVYLITGFLESGKTTFLKDVLASPDFADGQKTLLIQCEEGEEEYDEKECNRHNIEIINVENEADLTPEFLDRCNKYYKPYRVFVEFNGMWDAKRFAAEGMPKRWEIVQIITIVDGSTFEVYLNNMRSILSNIFALTEMVIFNRCTPDMDLHKYRRSVKAINQQVMCAFEDADGNQVDIGKAQPPYDLNAPVIDITDVDFGLWFLDMTDNPERYEGKTVRFLGKVMIPRKFPSGSFIPGRNAMTCCANDIRFVGYICRSNLPIRLKQKDWVTVTAKVKYENAKEYGGEGPILYATDIRPTAAPADELVYFN